MNHENIENLKEFGLHREEHYLKKVKNAFNEGKFPPFQEVLGKILEHKVTIEQEVFLHHK